MTHRAVTEPVLFWPARLEGKTLFILDETKIPGRIVYLKVRDFEGSVQAVKEMRTRAFGQFLTVCYTFMLEVKRHPSWSKAEALRHFETVSAAFRQSRPTFPFEEVTGMVTGVAAHAPDSVDFGRHFLAAMENMLENGIRRQRYARIEAAAALIKNGDHVLTHCHVSGEMALIASACQREGKKVRFFCTETRPYLQGARLTAWELSEHGFDVTLVADNAVASLLSSGSIQTVIVGSDRSAANGDFANKVGTYQIALLAKHFHVPFYVLTQPSEKIKSGRDLPIEIRSDDEVLVFEGQKLARSGVKAYYPGFDVVEADLVTRHIPIGG